MFVEKYLKKKEKGWELGVGKGLSCLNDFIYDGSSEWKYWNYYIKK